LNLIEGFELASSVMSQKYFTNVENQKELQKSKLVIPAKEAVSQLTFI